jgi:hypothetical protein
MAPISILPEAIAPSEGDILTSMSPLSKFSHRWSYPFSSLSHPAHLCWFACLFHYFLGSYQPCHCHTTPKLPIIPSIHPPRPGYQQKLPPNWSLFRHSCPQQSHIPHTARESFFSGNLISCSSSFKDQLPENSNQLHLYNPPLAHRVFLCPALLLYLWLAWQKPDKLSSGS